MIKYIKYKLSKNQHTSEVYLIHHNYNICLKIFILYLFLFCIGCISQMEISDRFIWHFNPFPNNKFTLFQTERVCIQQFQNLMKMADSSPKRLKKLSGKRRNCSLRAISPFLKVFQKDPYCKHIKTRACLGKG